MAIKNSPLKILGGLVSLCGFLMLSTRPMFAEVNVGAVQYQYIQELGEIVINSGDIAVIENNLSDAVINDLHKKDIFVVSCQGQPQTFKRQQKIGEHLIDTEISLAPPKDHGFAGMRSTASLVLSVDGKKRVDCDIEDGYFTVRAVALSVHDGFLAVEGEHLGKQFRIYQSRLDKQEVIGDKALMDAAH